jgi:hypothetical protein
MLNSDVIVFAGQLHVTAYGSKEKLRYRINPLYRPKIEVRTIACGLGEAGLLAVLTFTPSALTVQWPGGDPIGAGIYFFSAVYCL